MTSIVVSNVEEVNETGPNGARIVARFGLAFGGELYVNGCALLHRRDHGWSIWGPSRSVQFTRRARKEIKLTVLRTLGWEIPPQME